MKTITKLIKHSMNRWPLRRGFIVIPMVLVCFAFAPALQAVTPAPDGGYPNRNTAEGDDALFSLTSGDGNTALGFQALYLNTTGEHNTAVGREALFNNTNNNNTAIGVVALYSNTTGDDNTAIGLNTLVNNNWQR